MLCQKKCVNLQRKTNTMNIAVILAGGVGSRVGADRPKQFLEIRGRMVIERTIDAFEANANIDEIAVVINPMYIEEMESIVKRNRWKKVRRVLKGGAERYMSTLSAIKAYGDLEEANVLFHDAVRPMVSQARTLPGWRLSSTDGGRTIPNCLSSMWMRDSHPFWLTGLCLMAV